MYDNISEKIKSLAGATFALGAFMSIILGVWLISIEHTITVPLGIIIIVVGPVASWASSWMIYGFGELIENTSDLKSSVQPQKKPTNKKPVEDKLPEL